jgi:dUTP pyrophosphatase
MKNEVKDEAPRPFFRVKKLVPEAKLPMKGDPADMGFDLLWCGHRETQQQEFYGMTQWVVPTGLAMSCQPDLGFEVRDRSSMALKYGARVIAGIIDSGYRGELLIVIQFPHSLESGIMGVGDNRPLVSQVQAFRTEIKPGDKIAQLLIRWNPTIDVKESEELPPSNRGEKGWGSTGK